MRDDFSPVFTRKRGKCGNYTCNKINYGNMMNKRSVSGFLTARGGFFMESDALDFITIDCLLAGGRID